MDTHDFKTTWIERVEDLIRLLEGSSISELELTEAGTEIRIRRQPGMMLGATPTTPASIAQVGIPLAPGVAAPTAQQDTSLTIIAPLTGVFYEAPSLSSPPFVP